MQYGYFSGWNVTGAAHTGPWLKKYDINNMITCLNISEIRRLLHFNQSLKKLGNNIKKGDDRYKQAQAIYDSVQDIFDKLAGPENAEVFELVQIQETEYLMDEYSLSEGDIQEIFDNYGQMYRDRSVVSYVFKDIDECAEEEAESLGYVNKKKNPGAEKYFNYTQFGEDLLEENGYLKLDDGRIVYLTY